MNKKYLINTVSILIIIMIAAGFRYYGLREIEDEEYLDNMTKPLAEIPAPIIKDNSQPKQEETINDKTYRNEKYGFEFIYPQNFLIGKYKPEVTSSSVPQDLREQLSDLSWNNAVVLIEPELIALFSKSPRAFLLDKIPVGDVSTISIKPITTSADFYRKAYIDNKANNPTQIKIGGYTVTKLPGYPGPYGDTAYYYLLPLKNGLILEFTGHRKKFPNATTPDSTAPESHYDQVIEKIISTLNVK